MLNNYQNEENKEKKRATQPIFGDLPLKTSIDRFLIDPPPRVESSPSKIPYPNPKTWPKALGAEEEGREEERRI